MKSKIYSSRYMKVTSKGLVWIPAFVTIGFLLAFPVAELLTSLLMVIAIVRSVRKMPAKERL